jgi:hypothetical protein
MSIRCGVVERAIEVLAVCIRHYFQRGAYQKYLVNKAKQAKATAKVAAAMQVLANPPKPVVSKAVEAPAKLSKTAKRKAKAAAKRAAALAQSGTEQLAAKGVKAIKDALPAAAAAAAAASKKAAPAAAPAAAAAAASKKAPAASSAASKPAAAKPASA